MLYYLVVFVVLLGVELLYFRVADHFNIIDKPNERSSHTRITLRGGGVVFYVGALVYFVASGFSFPWFMLGLTLIAGVSFVDDVRSVTQRVRLVVHFVAMLLMFYQWVWLSARGLLMPTISWMALTGSREGIVWWCWEDWRT